MENGTKLINLRQVAFPVYRLGLEPPNFIGNVVLFYQEYKDDEGNPIQKYRVVDDKDIDKPTLALRRLELAKNKVKLKRLSRAVFFLADFIKLATRETWFIDSNGMVFQYKKEKHIKLLFKPIKQIIPIDTGGAIIEVEGIPSRFKTLYMPDSLNKYAGVLQDGMGYILYGTYIEPPKNSRRLI